MDARKWDWAESISRRTRTIIEQEPMVVLDENFFRGMLRNRMVHMGFTLVTEHTKRDIRTPNQCVISVYRITTDRFGSKMLQTTKERGISLEHYDAIPSLKDITAYFPGAIPVQQGGFNTENRFSIQLKVGMEGSLANKTWNQQYSVSDSDLATNIGELFIPEGQVDAVCFVCDELFYLRGSEGDWMPSGGSGGVTKHVGTTGCYTGNDGPIGPGLLPPLTDLLTEPGHPIHFTGLWKDPKQNDAPSREIHGIAMAQVVTGLETNDLVFVGRTMSLPHQHDGEDKFRCSVCDYGAEEGTGVSTNNIIRHWSDMKERNPTPKDLNSNQDGLMDAFRKLNDEASPNDAIIELIIEATQDAQEDLRTKLEKWKLSALKEHATEAGVNADLITAAEDAAEATQNTIEQLINRHNYTEDQKMIGNQFRITVLLGTESDNCPFCNLLEEE